MDRRDFLQGIAAAAALVIAPVRALARPKPEEVAAIRAGEPLTEDVSRLGIDTVRIPKGDHVAWTIQWSARTGVHHFAAANTTTIYSPGAMQRLVGCHGDITFPLPSDREFLREPMCGREYRLIFEGDGEDYTVDRAIVTDSRIISVDAVAEVNGKSTNMKIGRYTFAQIKWQSIGNDPLWIVERGTAK